MRQTNGIALISALIFMFIIVVFLSIVVTNSVNNQRNATDFLRTSQAQFAAEAGLDDAVAAVWHRLWSTIPPEQRSLTRYNTELGKEPLKLGTVGAVYTSSKITLSSGSSYSYEIARLPDVVSNGVTQSILLRVRATGTLPDGKTTRILQSDFAVQRGFFPFDFALLTNKAECLFCHADIKSLDAFNGAPSSNDPSSWWRRTKVGVLDSLIMRGDEHAGTVSGSILTRGRVYQQGGSPGVSNLLYTNVTVGQDRISSNQPVAINSNPDYQADCEESPADCDIKRALYLNYPTGSSVSDFPDGELPTNFPLPIPDANNNRVIDDDEWKAALDESVAGTSDMYPNGSITADMQIGPGSLSWGGSRQTRTSNDLGNLPNTVILDGSSNPILIDGTVFINGDLIIRGRTSGNGTLIARGNIYVLGDLTYDCTPTQSKVDCDYSKQNQLPQLSLIAGGSVLVSDYATVTTLNDNSLDLLKPGNVQASFTYCKSTPPDPSRCGPRNDFLQPNFILTQMANFNRDELWKALNDPNYTPRFYTYGESEVYYTNNCAHNAQDYSAYRSLSEATRAGGSVQLCAGDTEVTGEAKSIPGDLPSNVARAAKIELNPKSFTAEDIKNLWIESVKSRAISPLRTDGLLYSANAIFSVLPHDNPGAVTKGQWDLRGALVAPDTGILAPGPCTNKDAANTCIVDGKTYENFGLRIYHDGRLRPRIAQNQRLGLFRSQWQVIAR